MNKTTTLVGLFAGLTGAGITYIFKSKDTTHDEGITKYIEPNSNLLRPIVRISTKFNTKYHSAIEKSREHVRRFKQEIGIPGLVVGVSVDGEIIWEEGFGYANVENTTPCHAATAMRIASISKAITAVLLAKLCETKKLELDKSVHEYVPYFPKKKVDGQEVDITIRQLASHTAGVRHYAKKGEQKDENCKNSKNEFYIKEKFENIEKSIELFKNDELLFRPGTSYEYTTHGYTLLSAAIENAGQKAFIEQIQEFFRVLGLENTHLDKVNKIISSRASYYDKNKYGYLENAELADTSYKWAGGGFISTVGDLLKFGNAMLYSFQQNKEHKPGFLKKFTIQEMWTPVKNTVSKWGQNAGYGLGWMVVPKVDDIGGLTTHQLFHVGHSGAAVGASSVLLIFPKEIGASYDENKNMVQTQLPQGVIVAVLVNLENVSCRVLGQTIAKEFYTI